jgi:hypothetical protein
MPRKLGFIKIASTSLVIVAIVSLFGFIELLIISITTENPEYAPMGAEFFFVLFLISASGLFLIRTKQKKLIRRN